MSRELDALVAEKVMGWHWCPNWGCYTSEEWKKDCPPPDGIYKCSERISFSDVASDYEVLKQVREKWLIPDQYLFLAELCRLIEWRRRKVAGQLHSSFFMFYEPGDYSRAALKVLGEVV